MLVVFSPIFMVDTKVMFPYNFVAPLTLQIFKREYEWKNLGVNACKLVSKSGPLLENKGMHVIFQKKGKKRAKKGKIFEKLSKNSKKIEFFFKKNRWLHAIISCNKLLEKALSIKYTLYFCLMISAAYFKLLSYMLIFIITKCTM